LAVYTTKPTKSTVLQLDLDRQAWAECPFGSTGPQSSQHLALANLCSNFLLGLDPTLTRVSSLVSVGSGCLIQAWFCCGHWNYRAQQGPVKLYVPTFEVN